MGHDLRHICFVGAELAPKHASPRKVRPLIGVPGSSLQTNHISQNRNDTINLDSFLVWILQKAGLQERAYRPVAMQRRLPACLRKLRVSSTEEARALLEKRPELMQDVMDTLLIGVTAFFRDQAVFDSLRKEVLPELLQTRSGLRVCSAGVSEGHELYSVAMLLEEAGALEKSELLGFDCRAEGVARAEEGCFDEDDLAGMEAIWRNKYFRQENSCWFVKPELQARIRWRVEDLFSFSSDRPLDMILFRNVVIYFSESHAAMAWEKLCSQLAPGGILVTGTADKPSPHLPLVRVAASIYKKTGN